MRSRRRSGPDHPRSRGVYWLVTPDEGARLGSSPLARGLRHSFPIREYATGIIPARAGFTLAASKRLGFYHGSSPLARGLRPRTAAARGTRPDHPRSRGVYVALPPLSPIVYGSSPLARGLHLQGPQRPAPPRIIPARAGFTHTQPPSSGGTGDHPRSRGVYMLSSPTPPGRSGSSPLARGLPSEPRPGVLRIGIIPARAGFTPSACAPSPGRPDHPRSRGVYDRRMFGVPLSVGSSPLARGLPRRHERELSEGGIIPARAGFTGRAGRSRRPLPDHPRSRGVYRLEGALVWNVPGSSPLARGLRAPRQDVLRGGRIIPARAGFTKWVRSGRPLATDHPRSRGVYLMK